MVRSSRSKPGYLHGLSHTRSNDNMPASLTSSTHGKLHKRGNSASSIHSPMSPVSVVSADRTSFSYARSSKTTPTYHDPWAADVASEHASAHKGLKIKPYLRKLSPRESNSIDLSRPAAENELLGLGIQDAYVSNNYRSASDVQFAPVGPRQRHTRSTSNNSQFSISSTMQPRPTAPFKHQMRHNPRPYTPPTAQSYPNSTLGEDVDSAEADDVMYIMSDEEYYYRQHVFDPTRRSGSLSSATVQTAPQLSLHTSSSFPKLGSASQTSLSLVSPSSSRPRGDTLRSFETTTATATATSPSSRASFDRAFSFLRGRDSPIDPATRAREIQAARIAYREREEAKDRKAEKEALKQADREARKMMRQEERKQRKSEAHSRSASVSNEKLPRPSVGGRQYSDYARTHGMSTPLRVDTGSARRTESTPGVSAKKQAKTAWLTFITWFRTRLLRIGRKMGKRGE